MKKYDPTSLKWGICDENDRLVATFYDQDIATQFYGTLKGLPQFSSQNLQIVNVHTGEPASQRETAGDRVSA